MKSQHRHELETNWLAQHAARWIDKARPYQSLVTGIIVAVAVLVFGISYFSGASAARQSEAWNSYNQAVEGVMPNLETLRESAQEYPDSPMQQWADVTWADGQVWIAARYYLQNRAAATDALNRATSAYENLIKESDDQRLVDRAHFGLGRVYELRNELDKAREEYLAVKGGFARLAAQRAKELEEPVVKDTYAWLATAEAPRRAPPAGPGTPGQRPDFAPGDLEMPAAGAPAGETGAPISVEDLFKGIGETPANDDADRYEPGDAAAENAATDEAATPNDEQAVEPKE